jgi:GT2 family glycosyltransferase
VVLVEPGRNVAVAGRNLGARAARNELLLMLDDDAYPVPGAVEALRSAMDALPATAVVGGLVLDVEADGTVLKSHEVGTFDWFLRGGRRGEAPVGGWPCFFFPEGASLVRRTPYLQVGGYFEPYFFATSEVDLTTRLVGAGYDVRYEPRAQFHHLKVTEGRTGGGRVLRYRVRNQVWYFWRHFPVGLAVRRIVAYAIFDLVEAVAVGAVPDYLGGLKDSWRQRDAVRGTRKPLPRASLRRAELNRGRIHLRLLAAQLRRKTLNRLGAAAGP